MMFFDFDASGFVFQDLRHFAWSIWCFSLVPVLIRVTFPIIKFLRPVNLYLDWHSRSRVRLDHDDVVWLS